MVPASILFSAVPSASTAPSSSWWELPPQPAVLSGRGAMASASCSHTRDLLCNWDFQSLGSSDILVAPSNLPVQWVLLPGLPPHSACAQLRVFLARLSTLFLGHNPSQPPKLQAFFGFGYWSLSPDFSGRHVSLWPPSSHRHPGDPAEPCL